MINNRNRLNFKQYYMRKLIAILFVLLPMVINAQRYVFEFDIDFQFDVCRGSRRYYGNMYYTTMNNPTVREVYDFQFYRERGTRNCKNKIYIDLQLQSIKQKVKNEKN